MAPAQAAAGPGPRILAGFSALKSPLEAPGGMGSNVELDELSKVGIPDALEELKKRHLHVNELLQWCESSYQAGNKREVEAQTKEYLVDALEAVASDINVVGTKLNRFLALEADAIGKVADTVADVHRKLDAAKAQNADERLSAFLRPAAADDERPRRKSVEKLNEEEMAAFLTPLPSYEKSLAKRLDAFASLGTKS